MKFGTRGVVIWVAILALLVTAAPTLAAPRVDTVNFEVENRTGSSVQLTLNGPGPAQEFFIASAATDELELEPGEYYFKYEACGHMNAGVVNVADNNASLILKKCPGVAISNIVLDNQTGSPFIVTITGAGGMFGYWVPVGGMNIQLPAGGYEFNSNACGEGYGTLKASASLGQPLIWTWDCAGGDAPVLTPSAE
jgi:hypothetical protein